MGQDRHFDFRFARIVDLQNITVGLGVEDLNHVLARFKGFPVNLDA